MGINLKSKLKRAIPLAWIFLILFLLTVNYNNCSASKMNYNEAPTQGNNTLDLQTICSMTELDLFSQGFHRFTSTTCNGCHISGPGKGAFANPDAAPAFSDFQSMGFEKISAMAVSDSHNYPATGAHNIERVSALKDQWRLYQTEKKNCSGGSTTAKAGTYNPNFISGKKIIPIISGTPKVVNINGTQTSIIDYNSGVVTFDLDKDLVALIPTPLPATGGATLSFFVSGYSTPAGLTGYMFAMPKLKTGSNSLHIKGFHLHLNGMSVSYALTYQNKDETVYKYTEKMLSGGSMLVLGPLLADDQLAVSIGSLEVVDLAAPPAPPKVDFNVSASTVGSTQLGYAIPYKVKVRLNTASTNPINVTLTTEGDQALAGIAKSVLGPSGKNRFDWDYKIITPLNLTFNPGDLEKEIDIVFSDDLRDDPDKTLILSLVDPFGAALGTNTKHIVSLPDYNPAPSDGHITLAELMNPGGVLESNCVRCHNSIDKQGGYDMTDYQMMVNKGVIVPGNSDPNAHKMFRRMNPDAANVGSITPMPLKGYLSQDQTIIVEDWFVGGAKNN
jgi:hypothetical protein